MADIHTVCLCKILNSAQDIVLVFLIDAGDNDGNIINGLLHTFHPDFAHEIPCAFFVHHYQL